MAMGYFCDLGFGQSIYLENRHSQTLVTVASSNPEQQQQSSHGFQTGSWVAPPELFRSSIGVIVKLHTAQGEWFVSMQGSSLSVSKESPSWANAQPLCVQLVAEKPVDSMPTSPPMPIQPMTPMPPMTMGNMQMDRNTMSMQMGNMSLSLHPIGQSTAASPQPGAVEDETTASQQNFCSQCGVAIKPSDRFCAHCGHRLA